MEAFGALADPTRRRIVELLAERQQTAGELAKRFSITQPAVSQHLRTLRDAGLVNVRPDAQRRIYTLNPQGFSELDAWLSRYRSFWNTRLNKLENALEEDSK